MTKDEVLKILNDSLELLQKMPLPKFKRKHSIAVREFEHYRYGMIKIHHGKRKWKVI